MTSVADNFKQPDHAALYVKYRPVYPAAVTTNIINYLNHTRTSTTTKHPLAIDAGCGSGQTTFPLCPHFDNVIGVDTSEAQISEGRRAAERQGINVTFRVGDAQDLSFLADASVDLITVGTALHWFNVEGFCAESARVLRPGGVLAAYSYNYGEYTAGEGRKVDQLNNVVKTMVEEYGDPQLAFVQNKYLDYMSIFERHFSDVKRDDSYVMELTLGLEEFRGFMQSWSAYRKMKDLTPSQPDPLDIMIASIQEAYNGQIPEKCVNFISSIFIVLGRK